VALTTYVRDMCPRLWFFGKFQLYRFLKGELEIRALRQVVPRGRLAIDVGASIGLYARELSHLTPKVVAFEANPAVAAFARAVAPANVEVVNVALSATEGRAVLRIPVNRRGNSTDELATIESRNQHYAGEMFTVEVATRRLDDYAFTDCGFIKIDVEGHEEAVLDGGARLIEMQRPVLMIELADMHNPGTIGRVVSRFTGLSYVTYFLWHGSWRPFAEFDERRHQNLALIEGLPRRARRRAFVSNFFFFPQEAIPAAVRATA
jgi:FkbM family methyltransferase